MRGWIKLWIFLGGALLGAAGLLCWRHLARPETPRSRAEAVTEEVVRLVRDLHPEGGRLSEREIRAEVARGRVVPGDPYSAILSRETVEAIPMGGGGSYAGVGLLLERRGEDCIVIATLPESPAREALILPGSCLVAAGGAEIRRAPLPEVVRRLAGEPGTEVEIQWWTPEGSLRLTRLRRRLIRPASVEASRIDGDVAVVRAIEIAEGLDAEILAALRAGGGPPRAIVLDLRDCGGGSVEGAVRAASLFVPPGTLLARLSGPRWRPGSPRAGEAELHARGNGDLPDLPCVCLVNRRTASAAELLAGALRAAGRATLVGEPTFGKREIQDRFPLPFGNALLLTVGLCETGAPRAPEGGLRADVGAEDAASLQSAIALLRE